MVVTWWIVYFLPSEQLLQCGEQMASVLRETWHECQGSSTELPSSRITPTRHLSSTHACTGITCWIDSLLFWSCYCFAIFASLRGDKVSMLTHTYTHKPLRKVKWTSAITRLTAHLMCGLMFDLVHCRHREKDRWSYMTPNVLTETTPGVILLHKLTIFAQFLEWSFYICCHSCV